MTGEDAGLSGLSGLGAEWRLNRGERGGWCWGGGGGAGGGGGGRAGGGASGVGLAKFARVHFANHKTP